MATYIWTGATSQDPAVITNYDPNLSASTDELDAGVLIFNDQSTKAMDGADISSVAGVTLSILIEEGFAHSIGSSGTPLEVNGITLLAMRGGVTAACYFGIGATGTPGSMANVVCDTPATLSPSLVVDDTIVNWVQKRGHAQAVASATINGKIAVSQSGSQKSSLTIPSGVTLTGAETRVDGGVLDTSTTLPALVSLSSGEVVLRGAAGASDRIEASGGTVFWDALSTIALAEMRGNSLLKTRFARRGRTLTNASMYDDGMIDFSIGGAGMTFSNAIRVYGRKQPIFSPGMGYTPSE
jgi:hypothetical protein